ncbi:MAG: membrane protein insertase YidC [Candidatus Acidiferrum sp.]
MSTPPVNQFPPIGPKKDKFTPELRILVASLLSVGIIILWTKYFGPKPPVHVPQQEQPGVSAPATSGPSAATSALAEPTASTAPSAVSAAATPAAPLAEDTQERTIVVENALYRVEFSNRGAVVKSWQLKEYKDDAKPQRTLDLVHAESAAKTGGWPFSLVLEDPRLEKAANTGLYKISSASASLEAPTDLTFKWSDGHLEVIKKFQFDHSYIVGVETTTNYNGVHVLAGLAWRGGFGDMTVTNPAPITTITTFYSEGGKLTTVGYKKLDSPEKWGNVWQGGKTFTGIQDRYFAVTFLPPSDALSTTQETRYWRIWDTATVDGKEVSEEVPEVAAATSAQPMSLRVFVGPKDYDLLKKLNPPLHALVNFGWLEVIADPLFHGLKWLHEYIPNWGWSIVVLTLVINMVFFPLRISSYKTTLKMQRVGPVIKQIQEKYKKYKMNDPRKAEMNKEIMAIYSREGINPVGGCIPQLLQMPIWFGLWRALQGTIELRHAPWFGWIKDLSAKDPYYVLPVLMGVSMYLASKMTPMPTADAQQAQMMKFMPIAMAGMFMIIPYPSGVAVYILTSGLINILQQWYLNRTHPLPAPVKPVRAKK